MRTTGIAATTANPATAAPAKAASSATDASCGAMDNPLRGLTSHAVGGQHFLSTSKGQIVLVGHDYGGAVITNAAAGNPGQCGHTRKERLRARLRLRSARAHGRTALGDAAIDTHRSGTPRPWHTPTARCESGFCAPWCPSSVALRDSPFLRGRHQRFWCLAGDDCDPWIVDQQLAQSGAAVRAEIVIEVVEDKERRIAEQRPS
jgi:hypothetical protein